MQNKRLDPVFLMHLDLSNFLVHFCYWVSVNKVKKTEESDCIISSKSHNCQDWYSAPHPKCVTQHLGWDSSQGQEAQGTEQPSHQESCLRWEKCENITWKRVGRVKQTSRPKTIMISVKWPKSGFYTMMSLTQGINSWFALTANSLLIKLCIV